MELFESFKTVKDPRKNINKKHDFIDILFLTISAVISGALGWKDIKETAEAIRNHWGVENKAYWVLDVSFKEDASRIRSHDGAEDVAIIRRFCLNLCKLHPGTNSMVGKIKCCGWSDKFRSEVIFG